MVHERLSPIADHRDPGIGQTLDLGLEEVVTLDDQAHVQAAPMGAQQRIPDAPQVQVIDGDIDRVAGGVNGLRQRLVRAAPQRLSRRAGGIREVQAGPTRCARRFDPGWRVLPGLLSLEQEEAARQQQQKPQRAERSRNLLDPDAGHQEPLQVQKNAQVLENLRL